MALRAIHYEVTLPDERVKVVSLDKHATGYDCIKKLCHSLGVFDEADYFGLTYPGKRGEELWVNSRNRLAKQVPLVDHCRIRLAVRFFVQPHMLVEEETRQLFLLDALRRSSGDLKAAATAPQKPSLEQLSNAASYGCHFHAVKDCQRRRFLIGVNSEAVIFCGDDGQVLHRYAFPRVQKVTRSGRIVHLLLSNPEGAVREFGYRLVSSKAADGLYRCVTEMHSFFRCDSVRAGLALQQRRRRQRRVRRQPQSRNSPRSGDFKATLASLIKGGGDTSEGEAKSTVDSTASNWYAFDIRRTAREVHDAARRRQYKNFQAAAAAESASAAAACAQPTDNKTINDDNISTLTNRLDCLLQESQCRVCLDQPISIVFSPCGHMYTCPACSDQLAQCPICRASIIARQAVLLP